MMSHIKMDAKTEIRKLSPGYLFQLVQILEYDESWKRLMAIIPKTLSLDDFEAKIAINNLPKYNTEHFKLIENAGTKYRKPCSEILFEEWGTSGKIRPRLGHLLKLLERAELYRAADFIAVDLLKVVPPERPVTGPAAKVNVTFSDSLPTNIPDPANVDIEQILNEINYPSSVLNSYQHSTNNINQNKAPPKIIIPKIVVNEVSNTDNALENTTDSSRQFSNRSPNNRSPDLSTKNNNESLVWREVQLEKKIEKLRYSPGIPENITETTNLINSNNTSASDMIQFSSSNISDNQIPALSSLLDNNNAENNQNEPNETYNYDIPNLSELIKSENNLPNTPEPEKLPAFSQILSSDLTDSVNIPAFSQISPLKTVENLPVFSQIAPSKSDENIPAFSQISPNDTSENIPAFSQILNSNTDIPSQNLPSFSQLISKENVANSNNEIPHLSALLENNSCDNITEDLLPKLSLLQTTDKISTSELNVTRKQSLSPVNTSNTRSTCASPLPNLSLNTILPHFTYLELEQCTDNFDETTLNSHHSFVNSEPKGRKLGSGAFGCVYLGIGLLEKPVAVKKLNLNGVNVVNVDDTITKQFRNEVELLCKYKHENLLSLLGYSCDGPTYCLIYEYISGGALKDRLQCPDNRLIWTNRLYIALGTAKAVSYLHNAYSMPLIHRDIKSANILLDNANKPKLCDFGLIKLTPNQNTNTSTTVFGTSAYMAPEAFRGDVSVKLDTFSFGVVLLELLTGLPPLDEKREGNDLVTHVEDVCEDDIKPLLDQKAGSWMLRDTNFGDELYMIATQCLEEKKRRPLMSDVVKQLSQLIDKTV